VLAVARLVLGFPATVFPVVWLVDVEAGRANPVVVLANW
jgi:hypothetical protein